MNWSRCIPVCLCESRISLSLSLSLCVCVCLTVGVGHGLGNFSSYFKTYRLISVKYSELGKEELVNFYQFC